MAKNEKTKVSRQVKRVQKATVKFNDLFNSLLGTVSKANGGFDEARERELAAILQQANDVIDDELDQIQNNTGADISKFFYDLSLQENLKMDRDIRNVEQIFGMKKEMLYQMVESTAKNRNALYDRLALIAEHLYELEETINTARDSIVSPDEFTNRLSREIQFQGTNSNRSDVDNCIQSITEMERSMKIHQKIKSFIVPKTLTLGDFYAITIPYSHIFREASIRKAMSYRTFQKGKNSARDKKNVQKPLFEGMEHVFLSDDPENVRVLESINNQYFQQPQFNAVKELGTMGIDIVTDEDISPILLESVMGMDSETMSGPEFEKMLRQNLGSRAKRKENSFFVDGTVNASTEKFDDIKGCINRLVDPRRMLPFYGINDEVLGYIYIHQPMGPECGNGMGSNMLNRMQLSMNETDKEGFVRRMADKIYKAFSKKFLIDHIRFKDMIAEALLFDEQYRSGTTFQYIPVEYVTHFCIDEDMDGKGTSMLKRSLFKAHLYLGMYIFKYMSAIDRSNDTRIHYIRSSSLDKKTANQVERIMREVGERTPSFAKFYSYRGMMDTVNVANRDIFMPTGESDVKGVDFDVLSGQDVQMMNDFLESMRSDYINATGVPSVIMNYVNEADYAKTLVMANAKFLMRIINYQLDLNDGITEWYKKLIRYSGLDIPEEMISQFEFKFHKPKLLNFNTAADLVNQTEQAMMFIIKALTGENSDQTDKSNINKDKLFLILAEMMLPMFPWADYKDALEESRLDTEEEMLRRKADGEADEE